MSQCACGFQSTSVTVLHVPDEKYPLPARSVFQYLLTTQGGMYELKVCKVALLEFQGWWVKKKGPLDVAGTSSIV